MGRRAGKVVLIVLLIVALALLGTTGWLYWRVREALPQYAGEVRVSGLAQPVTVLRDARAVPHIYAESLADLLFAQGYVTAQERLWQMDTLRRMARGELAEIFGRRMLELDKENRILGLGGVAERAAELLDTQTRAQLEAYARGVNAFIETHRSRLPIEFSLLGYTPRLWTPSDTLAVGLNMFKLLSTTWPWELLRAKVLEKLPAELADDLYVARSALDRPVAEPLPRRGPRERPRVYVAERPAGGHLTQCRHTLAELAEAAKQVALAAGSNNWVVAGSRSASGQPLLANDPHLPHLLPAIWFAIHLKLTAREPVGTELNVAGVSLPGIPFVIIGHNDRVAWGMTNLWADVQDLYVERFHPQQPQRYLTPTGWQTVGRRVEYIKVRGEPDYQLEVLRTRHGPIVHDDGTHKLALRWTALEPELLSLPFYELNRAQNWDEFRRALALYGGPAQNFVYADVEGNIGYYGAGRVPVRRQGHGEIPVAGDTADYDWLGYIPSQELPQAFNPLVGILASANNRVVPEGYPHYLTDRWEPPYRIARIYELLENQTGYKPIDFLRLQGDIVSLPDVFLAQQLVAAGGKQSVAPAVAEALDLLRSWDGQMRAEEATPLLCEASRGVLLKNLLRARLGDDWEAYTWFMSPVFLENVLRARPARWLPEGYPGYDELLVASLTKAIEELRQEVGSASVRSWRWGKRLQVRFAHPLFEQMPGLRRWFSVSGPESGGRHSVKVMTPEFGVSLRLVMDLADFDDSLLNLTLGQSGHRLSPHYRDQYPAWHAGRSFPFPFSDTAVQQATRYRLQLLPRR